jgi:hypothetical protein
MILKSEDRTTRRCFVTLRARDTETQQATTIRPRDQSCNEGTNQTQVRFSAIETWLGAAMPYFNFDLVIGAEFKYQGGMILENTENAIDKADSLASELRIVRPELCSTGCAVRVTDDESNELYRTPVELLGRR